MRHFLAGGFCILALSLCVSAQNLRYSVDFPSITSQYTTPFLVANIAPNLPVLNVCNYPANNLPCTNYATTYTSAGVACPNGSQDTPDPQPSACQSTGDAQGNLVFRKTARITRRRRFDDIDRPALAPHAAHHGIDQATASPAGGRIEDEKH